MTVTSALLKARYIGIRELKEHLSERLKESQPIVITEHGTPKRVILSYRDVLELIEVFEELQDRQVIEAVGEGRRAIRKGAKGIPVTGLFNRIRASRK